MISQDILSKQISFVEHIMLKFCSNEYDLDDSEENINAAIEFTQINEKLFKIGNAFSWYSYTPKQIQDKINTIPHHRN